MTGYATWGARSGTLTRHARLAVKLPRQGSVLCALAADELRIQGIAAGLRGGRPWCSGVCRGSLISLGRGVRGHRVVKYPTRGIP